MKRILLLGLMTVLAFAMQAQIKTATNSSAKGYNPSFYTHADVTATSGLGSEQYSVTLANRAELVGHFQFTASNAQVGDVLIDPNGGIYEIISGSFPNFTVQLLNDPSNLPEPFFDFPAAPTSPVNIARPIQPCGTIPEYAFLGAGIDSRLSVVVANYNHNVSVDCVGGSGEIGLTEASGSDSIATYSIITEDSLIGLRQKAGLFLDYAYEAVGDSALARTDIDTTDLRAWIESFLEAPEVLKWYTTIDGIKLYTNNDPSSWIVQTNNGVIGEYNITVPSDGILDRIAYVSTGGTNRITSNNQTIFHIDFSALSVATSSANSFSPSVFMSPTPSGNIVPVGIGGSPSLIAPVASSGVQDVTIQGTTNVDDGVTRIQLNNLNPTE